MEDENHLLSGICLIYSDIREAYGDLDKDLVNNFNDILTRRTEMQNVIK